MSKISHSPWTLDRDHPRVQVRLNTSDMHALQAIFLERELELPLARRPKTIIDAGAFIGLSSIYFAWRFPDAKVVAIEPEKSNYELLVENIDGWDNIIAVRAALWKRATRLFIYNPGSGNWAYQVFRSKSAVRLAQRVPGVRLESLMEMTRVERVDILKVDIEGAEIEVFETAASWIQRVGVIIIELHDRLREGCESAVMRATTDFQIRRRQGEYTVLGRKGWL